MGYIENRRQSPISGFLRQETVGERGKNTCYSTSAINATVALKALKPSNAIAVHRQVIDDLMGIPDLWNGSFISVGGADPRIAEVIKRYIPEISLGIDIPIMKNGHIVGSTRTYSRNFSFDEVLDGLRTGKQAYVVISRESNHSIAITRAFGREIEYVNPMYPSIRKILLSGRFNDQLDPERSGKVEATLVTRR